MLMKLVCFPWVVTIVFLGWWNHDTYICSASVCKTVFSAACDCARRLLFGLKFPS